jgi:hypothetical protein
VGARQAVRLLLAGALIPSVGPVGALERPAAAKATPCERDQSPPMFSEIGTSDEAVEAFLGALQKAVASDDRRKVATLIRYPIAASTRDGDVTFKTPDAFLASYELVFTLRLKKTIAQARKDCLFTNWQGAMIHDGEIWFNPLPTGDLKITRINGPVGPGR